MVEIGEVVLAKLVGKKRKKGKKDKQRKKLAEQSVEAVYVGQVARTGEHIVAQPGGDAFRCRTVRRVPLADRWSLEKVLGVIATPRKPAPTRHRAEGLEPRLADENARRLPRGPREPKASGPDNPSSGASLEHPEARPVDIRDFRITDRILEEFGGLRAGCPGCDHKGAGLPGHRGHNRDCRLRLQVNMEQSAAGRAILDEARRRLTAKSGADAAKAAPAAPSSDKKDPEPLRVEETQEPEVEANMELDVEDAIGGVDTPRFGPGSEREEEDEDDLDELMELNEDTIEASRGEAKRSREKDSNDTDDEPNTKKAKLKKFEADAEMIITVENEHGKVMGRCQNVDKGPRPDSRGGNPAFQTQEAENCCSPCHGWPGRVSRRG